MNSLRDQFANPHGPIGAIVGHLLAFKNRRRSAWVVERLAPRPGERILEIGFGPGVDVARVLRAVGPSGMVAGLDISETMLRQAKRRNARAANADLRLGSVDDIPFSELDAAFAINCAQFWPDLAGGLRALRRAVRPGGRAVIAVQPRNPGATAEDSRRWLERLRGAASEAGWTVTAAELGPTSPPVAAVVCT